MNILVANVHNLESPELRLLAGELSKSHNVTVCSMATASRQRGNSFSGGSFPIKFKQIKNYNINNEKILAYKFWGTPADMISIMLGEVMAHRKPKIVICGINNGITIGTDVFCSSNIGMAMQSAFANVPCVAVGTPMKIGGHTEESLKPAVQFICRNIENIAKLKMPTDTFLNISIPLVKKYSEFQGVGISSMDNLTQMTKYTEKKDCNDNTYYWTEFVERESAEKSNASPTAGLSYFAKNYIIMSPLTYDCTDYEMLSKLQNKEDAE